MTEGSNRPAVVVEGVSRTYGGSIALDDVSFQVGSGEIVGLLGPNGAGKTTTVRVLSTLLPPSSGRFEINGLPNTESLAIRRQIGVLPESAGYPMQWTGHEYVRYIARLCGHSRSRSGEIALGLLTDVGLAERAKSRIGIYSRGMRQRLGVARALVNDPNVIFLDEPTLGLDPAGQQQMLDLIRDVAGERGATVILSTHFLLEVENVCSRILILNRGRLIADGSVAEIKRKAAIPREIRVQVPRQFHESARRLLGVAEGVTGLRTSEPDDDSLVATLDPRLASSHSEAVVNTAIRILVTNDVPIIGVRLDSGSLSDAFLSLTGGVDDV